MYKKILVGIAIIIVLGIVSVYVYSAASYRKALPGGSVSPTIYDPVDGHFYYSRGPAGSYGANYTASYVAGNDSHATGTIYATAALLVASNEDRVVVYIQNAEYPYSSASLFIGIDKTVTDSSGANRGLRLVQDDSMTDPSRDDIWGYCASTCTYSIREVE